MILSDLELLGALVLPTLHVLGALASVHALFHVRTPQGTTAWVLGLILLPWITLPAYLVLGRGSFTSYQNTLHRAHLLFHEEDQRLKGALAEQVARALEPHQATAEKDAALERVMDAPFTRGNALTLLIDGQQIMDALLEAISQATHSVHFQFFIMHDDGSGERFVKALCEAATRGVQVRVLLDAFGSIRSRATLKRKLRACGVQIVGFGTRPGWGRTYANFRNHRKLVIIDSRRAYLGGLNIGDEYLGENPRLSPWRDTHVAIEGPALVALQATFIQDWFWATKERLELVTEQEEVGDAEVLALPTGPLREHASCEMMFAQMIHRAKHRLWWATPYFIPSDGLRLALELAIKRGVDVRILLPDRVDHWLSSLSALVHLHELRDSGIRFMRYSDAFLHQKVILVDDHMAMVGSANLDRRSIFLHFELGVAVRGAAQIAAIEAMLTADLEKSHEVNDEYSAKPMITRIAARLAHLADPAL